MPTHVELLNAAATVLIVAAAHARTWHVSRRRHRQLERQLRACSRKQDEMREILNRWSGLT